MSYIVIVFKTYIEKYVHGDPDVHARWTNVLYGMILIAEFSTELYL